MQMPHMKHFGGHRMVSGQAFCPTLVVEAGWCSHRSRARRQVCDGREGQRGIEVGDMSVARTMARSLPQTM